MYRKLLRDVFASWPDRRCARAQYRRALAGGESGPCDTDRRERIAGGNVCSPGGGPVPAKPAGAQIFKLL